MWYNRPVAIWYTNDSDRREVTLLANANPMSSLFQRLATFGFDRPYVRKVALPDWWNDHVAETEDGYAQTLMLLSRNLGLDIRSLQNAEAKLECRTFGKTCYKMKRSVAEDQLRQAHCIAARAAQLACFATSVSPALMPLTAKEIRAHICKSKDRTVDFGALLDYCWELGIPVLHVSHFPKGARKMDGMAARVKGRPVIILSKTDHFSAKLLFLLAHELGHVILNHIGDSGMVLDEKIDRESVDEVEIAANTFAVELLTGKPDTAYWVPRNLIAQELADWSQSVGKRDQVDPGVVALNYAWQKGHWPVVQLALGIIEPKADAVAAVHTQMCARLDWDRLPAESRRFLFKVTGAEDKA